MPACVYNKENRCITPGITVGPHAECNTFNHGSAKSGFDGTTAGVGACLAADCKFNEQLECKALKISVMVTTGIPIAGLSNQGNKLFYQSYGSL